MYNCTVDITKDKVMRTNFNSKQNFRKYVNMLIFHFEKIKIVFEKSGLFL